MGSTVAQLTRVLDLCDQEIMALNPDVSWSKTRNVEQYWNPANQANEAQKLMVPYINPTNLALRLGIQTGHASGINSSYRLQISKT